MVWGLGISLVSGVSGFWVQYESYMFTALASAYDLYGSLRMPISYAASSIDLRCQRNGIENLPWSNEARSDSKADDVVHTTTCSVVILRPYDPWSQFIHYSVPLYRDLTARRKPVEVGAGRM